MRAQMSKLVLTRHAVDDMPHKQAPSVFDPWIKFRITLLDCRNQGIKPEHI